MNVRAVGAYIRKQRESSRLSLSGMSSLAGVSIPYLSQIERGLRRPSADILQAIAKALRISAETLYVQAGIMEERPVPDVAAALMADPSITERQKQALVQIYEAFRDEASAARRRDRRIATKDKTGRPGAAKAAARKRSTSRSDGRATARAARSPHPAPPRPSVTKARKEV